MFSFFAGAGFALNKAYLTADISSELGRINWAAPSWDMFIVLFFVIAAFLYGFSLGKDRNILILICIYLALAVTNVAPFINNISYNSKNMINDVAIPPEQLFILKIVIFLFIFISLFFLLSHSVNLKIIAKNEVDKWWHTIIFSILHVGFLICIILSFLPMEIRQSLSVFIHGAFIDDLARFIWTVSPIAAMVLIKNT